MRTDAPSVPLSAAQNAATSDVPIIRRVVLPLDGTPLAERAIDPAVALAKATGAEVVLVRCYEPFAQVPSDNRTFARMNRPPRVPLYVASRYLAQTEETLHRRGVRVNSRLFQWPADAGILQVATEGPASWVVMATTGTNTNADPYGQQSIATLVLRAGTVPVLLIASATTDRLLTPMTRTARVRGRLGAIVTPGTESLHPYLDLLVRAFDGDGMHAAHVATMPSVKSGLTMEAIAAWMHVHADIAVVIGSTPLADDRPLRAVAVELMTTCALPMLVVP